MTAKSKARKRGQASSIARRGKPITLAAANWDHGATGPANRHGLIIEERGEMDPKTGKITNPNGVTGARRVDLLEFWHKEGRISAGGFNAAVALRNAFEATQRSAGWPDNDRVQSSPKPDHAVTIQIDRMSAYHRIARHIGRDDREVISACVLSGQHPGRVRGALDWQGVMTHLSAALDRLSDSLARAR